MSGGYVKAYSDKTHFSVPADATDYTDDPPHQNGNGIYNDYTIDLQPKEYSSTFKIACFRFTNNRRTKCILFGGLLAFCVLLIVIIAIASASKSKSNPEENPVKTTGLIAYGPDADGKIDFNPTKGFMPYVDRIEAVMHEYSTVHQWSVPNKYIRCDENTTVIPEGKVCRYTSENFGNHCQNTHLYGMSQGRPCVLLVLKLPDDLKPVPLNFTNNQNLDVKGKLHERATLTDIGISCEGKTVADEDSIVKDKRLGNIIDYNPTNGFPMYSFLARDNPDYITPAVMVQFNSLKTNHMITIRCTAWGQNLKDEIYSTEFTFHIT